MFPPLDTSHETRTVLLFFRTALKSERVIARTSFMVPTPNWVKLLNEDVAILVASLPPPVAICHAPPVYCEMPTSRPSNWNTDPSSAVPEEAQFKVSEAVPAPAVRFIFQTAFTICSKATALKAGPFDCAFVVAPWKTNVE